MVAWEAGAKLSHLGCSCSTLSQKRDGREGCSSAVLRPQGRRMLMQQSERSCMRTCLYGPWSERKFSHAAGLRRLTHCQGMSHLLIPLRGYMCAVRRGRQVHVQRSSRPSLRPQALLIQEEACNECLSEEPIGVSECFECSCFVTWKLSVVCASAVQHRPGLLPPLGP
jgi:hypothetical protein